MKKVRRRRLNVLKILWRKWQGARVPHVPVKYSPTFRLLQHRAFSQHEKSAEHAFFVSFSVRVFPFA